jgi:hypothetical protein
MMKRFLTVFLALAVLTMAGQAHAAGSWAINDNQDGTFDGRTGTVVGLVRTFTADSANASIPSWPYTRDSRMQGFSGCIVGVEVLFGSTAPSALVVDLKTKNGQSLAGFPATSLAASGWAKEVGTTPVCVSGGLYGTFTTNATNSATGTVVVYVLR